MLDEVLKLDRSAKGHVEQANQLIAKGLIVEARDELETAVALEPDNVEIRNTLIGVSIDLHDVVRAEKHYRAVLAIDRSSAKTHFNYGMLLFSQRRFSEARAAFRRTLEINPRDAHACHQLGLAFENEGNDEQATRHYELAIQHDPTHRLAHFLLARQLIKRGDLSRSIGHIEEALEPRDARTPWFMRTLAGVHSQLGDFARAISLARDARHVAEGFGDSRLTALLDDDLSKLQRRVTLE